MRSDEHLIDELAEAVLDGAAIDWAAAQSNTERGTQRLRHLQVVARLANVHRRGDAELEMWGHIRIIERIGRGAFGDVYRGFDTRLEREVALKLIPADSATSTVIDEGRLLARVQHPNVVTIYGADRRSGYVGLWMELVRGQTLEQWLKTNGPIEPMQVARIGAEISHAVAAVHGAGLLHRDIKAHNVMRADNGRIVVMDFGAGRDAAARESDMTGTPLYLAPELFQGQSATVQSDIYSVGVLLYRLLTGSYPVQGLTVDEVRQAHRSRGRIDVRVVRADVPSWLARLIARATDVQPDQRHASAGDLHADLKRAIRSSRRRRRLASAVAVVAVVPIPFMFAQRAGWLSASPTIEAALASTFGASTRPVLPPGERPVIVVLPFAYHGNYPDGPLIAEGLASEIVHNLALLDGLDVIWATPSPQDRADLQTFGRQRGANLVLTASMFAWPNQLRVRADLVRVADNFVVWGDDVEPVGKDTLLIQEQISRDITNKLRLQGIGRRRYQLNASLQNKYLTARGLRARHRIEDSERAAELFQEVITAERSYAPAYAGLASALSLASNPEAEMRDPDPRMEPAATTAIDLDPYLAEAHAAIGSLHARNRKFELAHESFREAIRLDATLASAYTDYALWVLVPLGQLDQALALLEDARKADSESLDVVRVLAFVQVMTGLYPEAIENCRWVLARDPMFPHAAKTLARALILSGQRDEAYDAVNNWESLGYFYAVTGRRREAEAVIAANPGAPARHATIYAGLGDRERTLRALERTAELHWWRAAVYVQNPEFASVHSDPRLTAIKRRIGVIE